MKKLTSMVFVIATAVALTAGGSSVFAQDKSATVTNGSSGGSVSSATDFQARKTKILNHISDRLTKIQQIQSCVQAANDLPALQACKPHRDKQHGGGTDHSG